MSKTGRKTKFSSSLNKNEMSLKESSNDVLDNLGIFNPYILLIILSMAILWGLSILNVMRSIYYQSGLKCNLKDRECFREQQKMLTIEDEFYIHDNSLSIKWTSSVFFIGAIFGSALLSFLSNLIGRHRVVFSGIILLNLFAILSTHTRSYETFLLIRFCEGFFFTSSCSIAWIYVSECVSQTNHSRVLAIFGLFWVIGYCVIDLIGIFVPDWKDATIYICVPTAFLALIMWLILPESFHFLAERSKDKPLKEWLRRADRNSFEVALLTRVNIDKPTRHDFRELFQFISDNRKYVIYLILSFFITLINFFTYFAMSFYSTNLGGKTHQNYILSGLVELPAYLLAPLLIGRKWSLIIMNLLGSSSFILLVFLNESNRVVFVSFWLISKFAISACFGYLFVYSYELYPSIIRNTALGLCAVASNLGASLARHLYLIADLDSSLPWIIFSILSIISALFTLTFPETASLNQNKHLNVYNEIKV